MKKLVNNVKNESMECCELAVTSNRRNIEQDFKINVHDGKGLYETGVSTTFWSRLIITARILQPQYGMWTIIIRDKANKNMVIYKNHNVLPHKEISFNYKTGLKSNFLIEATWTQAKDTILVGEISINY